MQRSLPGKAIAGQRDFARAVWAGQGDRWDRVRAKVWSKRMGDCERTLMHGGPGAAPLWPISRCFPAGAASVLLTHAVCCALSLVESKGVLQNGSAVAGRLVPDHTHCFAKKCCKFSCLEQYSPGKVYPAGTLLAKGCAEQSAIGAGVGRRYAVASIAGPGR